MNALNNDGDTPLILAINSEDIDMVYILLERPDINIELALMLTNEEQSLAEDLEEDDQDQQGIPAYAIENYIATKKEKRRFFMKTKYCRTDYSKRFGKTRR